MPTLDTTSREILICSVTPYFLNQGDFWFEENFEKIKSQARTNAWWERNTLFLEKGKKINPSQVLKKLTDCGYDKVPEVTSAGEFSQRGGIIEVFPVNAKNPLIIEFTGNCVNEIIQRPAPLVPDAQKIKKKFKSEEAGDFREGDFVVHLDHGIGIYRGRTVENGREYHLLEYAPPARPAAPPDRLLVPAEQIKKISLYLGLESPKIHRLGGNVWINTKKKVKDEVEKFARDLLELYAAREISHRQPHEKDSDFEKELAASFKYIETPDQKRAIEEVKKDMLSARPMDRIVCGDVGFGKTEVAIRAAFKAVLSGRQVAVLAPTTILCDQHFGTFSERLKRFPVTVAVLSRLTPEKEQKKIVQQIGSGLVDIVIGTHRLLSADVTFGNLGLLIIDEEQRFGVRHKEKLKKMKNSIDILSLSATPIPRTLYLTLSGLRNISTISTPPPERLPIKTFILPYSAKIIKDSIDAELKRKGQVYFLHNRIDTLEATRQKILRMVSGARIAVIHGRAPETELTKVMRRFRQKEIDVLAATTIIENGLDNPNVNTLIADNASRLGLAQAYQIRGRIGRSNVQSFAYFLYQRKNLTGKSKERLEALKRAEALGSGYQIALRDLEIRGAGNILGKEQSGTANQVGLNLYCHILAEAIEKMKAENNSD